MNDWYVEDTALVNVPGGTLSQLAAARVEGKPYTVSEYNHPQPIQYGAEGFPMIAAFGAFQDWDAIYSFDYAGGRNVQPRQIDGFFDIQCDTAKLTHMPACAALFRSRRRVPCTQDDRRASVLGRGTAAASRDAQRLVAHGGNVRTGPPVFALARRGARSAEQAAGRAAKCAEA